MTSEDPEARVRRALDDLGADYELLACDPALADTAAFVAAYGVPADRSANTLLVSARRGPERTAACVVLATTRLDVNGAVRRALGVAKLSFADPDRTREQTGMELGGVAPFGLPGEVEVLVDAAVLTPDWVVVGGGSRAVKVRLDPAVLRRAPRTRVVEGLAVPVPAPAAG